MSTPRYVQVAVPLPVRNTFTYSVPEDLGENVATGSRVLVPFGPRTLTGVVTGEGTKPPKNTRAISEVLDAGPVLNPELLELTRWIADYYCCGWGEAIRSALPPGTEVSSRLRAVLVDGADQSSLTDAQQRLAAYLTSHPNSPISRLERDGFPRSLVRAAENGGVVRVHANVSTASVSEKRQRTLRLVDPQASVRGPAQKRIIEYLTQLDPAVPLLQEVLRQTGASRDSVKRLVERDVLEFGDRVVRRDQESPDHEPVSLAPDFHPFQQRAVRSISESLESGEYHTFLIHGITGSGKTEVYLAALEQALAAGKTGIVLVPEISLTPQTVRRFRDRFGNRVGVLHSRMAAGERFDTWHAIRRGEYSVVVGPRSAILAPLDNLGLIVVDEEHESSYKQFDPAPRYHARDVAIVRAKNAGAVCILGSATPSLESLHNARTGKYGLLSMPERAPTTDRIAARLPDIRIVDLTAERSRLRGALSTPLRLSIQARLERKEQVILLRNRRGYAPVLECDSCGWSPECPDCSVTMTHHKALHQIRCHYCGRANRIPEGCPDCDGKRFVPLGAGTQRVEEELAATFPEARVLRMDLDTTGRKNAHRRILAKFGKGEADILLGTQMVAKGLDFERVTLVGVIDADSGLLFPDFRAEERSFQLLTQVAGRAGRADLHGEVLLQTRNPRHPVLRYVRKHDYERFADAALEMREQFSYPPFGRLIRIEVRADEDQVALNLASRWVRIFSGADVRAEISGPAPAFVSRVRKSWRYQILIKTSRDQPGGYLRRAIAATGVAVEPLPRGARLVVDIDPVGML